MKSRFRHLTVGALASATLQGCAPGSLAEAGGETLTVDEAAALIADHSSLRPDTQVVRVVAELWVDYTLLSRALARDSTLALLELGPATRQALDQIALERLASQAVAVDSVLTDEELQDRFAAEMPGARATASQILLAFPQGATGTQRDSIRQQARALWERAAAGEDFAGLAGRFSSDPGSGRFGGSMGTFERGVMLPNVDEAVFSLRPGQIAEPVETEVGVHILRLDALDVPDFEQVGETYRLQIMAERRREAEDVFMERLADDRGLVLTADALEVARALARAPEATLGPAAPERRLATFQGGDYRVADLLPLLRNGTPSLLNALGNGSDEVATDLLTDMARQRMLVLHAEGLGLAATPAEADSVATEARTLIRDLASRIGLSPAPSRPGDTARAAGATDAVFGALRRVVAGEQEIIPLAGITFLLRRDADWAIRERAVGATITRARQLEGGGD